MDETNPDIHPHTASFHERARRSPKYFELCFIGNTCFSFEWVDVFQNIETSMGYVRCESHPEMRNTSNFEIRTACNATSMACRLRIVKPKNLRGNSQKFILTSPKSASPKSSKGPLIFVLLFLGLIYLIHLINSNSSTSTTSITNQQNTSEFRVAASCASENLSGCSDLKICAMATDKINKYQMEFI